MGDQLAESNATAGESPPSLRSAPAMEGQAVRAAASVA